MLASRSAAPLESLAASLGGPGRALAVACDVAEWDQQARLKDAALEAFGQVDAVFANGWTPQATHGTNANTLYLNEGGSFAASPAWTEPATARLSQAVAVGDLDGDGRLDVVFANSDAGNAYHLNVGGPTVLFLFPDE